jgi:hypothetical protein
MLILMTVMTMPKTTYQCCGSNGSGTGIVGTLLGVKTVFEPVTP